MNKTGKLAILNAAIVLVNIFLFSGAFLRMELSGATPLTTALGITVIVMSVVVFLYGNYKILNQKEKAVNVQEIKTLDDCLPAIERRRGRGIFAGRLETVEGQIRRYKKKKETIEDILLQKFSNTEMSFGSFHGTLSALGEVMYLNVKSLLNRIGAFDEEEYSDIKKALAVAPGSEVLQSKLGIYDEYIAFVDNAVDDNEQILLKLDRLLSEISKFNSLEDGELENMAAMQEIDELIKNAKWYK